MDQMSEQSTSPGDRGKRLANFPAQSPDKQPPTKKQHGAATCSPTTGNPASEHSLKAMLMSLQTDLHRELKISINQIQDKVNSLEQRTDHIEQHLSETIKAHNAMVDIQDEQAAAVHQLCLKRADLKDRW